MTRLFTQFAQVFAHAARVLKLAPKGIVVCLLWATLAQSAEVTHLNSSGLLPPGVPFSEAVRVDDTLYLAGQLGNLPNSLTLVAGGIRPEARQTMENIRSILTANGLTMDNVVKCTVMMADISEWGVFNEVYAEFFAKPYPARSAFAASGLALGARVEVECLAVFP